jgi:hypothetical protein
MNLLRLPWRQPAEPKPDDDLETELDRPAFLRRTGEWRSGLRGVHLAPRPLEWCNAPTNDGYYFVRLDATDGDKTVVLVQGGFYRWKPNSRPIPIQGSGLQWAGPLPEPTP